MNRRHFLMGAAAAGVTVRPLAAQNAAHALPVEIRLLVGFAAGGATDLLARRMQPLLERRGHRLIIENLPGGGSTIALARAALAPGDGRTVGFASGGLLSLVASKETPLRLEQFANLVRVSEDPAILVVGHQSPIRTPQQAIEAIRAGRGGFSAGAAGPEGALGHLTLSNFVSAIGAEYIYVGYPGASRVANELMGGHLGAALVKPADVSGQIRNNELRPILQFADARLPQFPDVPTSAELGINVFPYGRMVQMTYVVAPASTPAPIRDALTALFRDVVLSPEFQEVARQEAFVADAAAGAALERSVAEMFAGFQAAYARTQR